MSDSGMVMIGIGLISLAVYLSVILWIRKKLIKQQVSCRIRSTFLAFFLAPGLILFGEHAGIPLPSFAWMSGVNNLYNCVDIDLFCSFELNLYLVILPFVATWIFAFMMCQDSGKS